MLLDIDMPEIDGITALPLLLAKKPDLVVIMASTLTRRNAEITLKCLSLGAADYLPKPRAHRDVTTSAAFRGELIDKVRISARRARRAPAGRRRPRRRRRAAPPPEPGPRARPCGRGRRGARRRACS